MADARISDLAALDGDDLAAGDLFAVVDVSATTTKSIRTDELLDYLVAGSSGQLQYNASGAFGGAAALAYATSGDLLTVTAQAASDKPLAVKGAASQSANLQEWRNSAGTVLLSVTSAGVVLVPDGSVSAPSLALGSVTSIGFFRDATWGMAFAVAGGSKWSLSQQGPVIASDGHLRYSAASPASATVDAGLTRSAAGVLRVSNGSTGIGAVLSSRLVEANTAGSGSPNVLVGTESGTVLTNEGATAQNYHTLPTAVAGLVFEFVVQDSDGVRVVAATGDTIRDVGTVSTTAGYIQSTTVGSTLRLVAINATEWVVTAKQGTWTIDS